MPWGAVAYAGSTYLNKRAADKAAGAQERGQELGIQEQQRQYDLSRGDQLQQLDLTRGDLAPYRALGPQGISGLSGLLGLSGNFDPSVITRTPGYQFGLDQGVQAMDRSAAARGVLGTGGYGQDLTRFGQNYAAGGYNDYYNKLSNLIGIGQSASNQTGAYGQNAANQIGAYGQNAANQISGAYGNIGDARAGGILGAQGAINQGIGGLSNMYFAGQMNRFPSSYGR